MSWITTANNHKLDYLNPDPSQISILDIATGLSNIPRWSGQINRFYSVAEHSILVTQIYEGMDEDFNPDIMMALLMHDATEAYMCDIPRPLKQLIPEYKSIEKRLDIIIKLKFGIADDPEIHNIVRKYDNICLKSEAIIRGGDINWISEDQYASVPVAEFFMLRHMYPKWAAIEFIKKFTEFGGHL